jgi:hypothetical protein
MSAQPHDLRDAGERHLVAFYDGDGHLTEAVVRFLGQALNDGDAALLVATAEHRRQFRAALEAEDIDTAQATAEGRLVVLDAEATLSEFLVGGMPDRTLFRGMLSGTIRQAAAGHRRVRVYGEMVALLWAWDNPEAAIVLEDLWNELAADHPFALLCAYPVHEVDAGGSAAFLTVCQQHSVVLPHEHFDAGPDWAERRQAILDTGSPSGDDSATTLDHGVRADFVTEMVEHLRTGIIDRGQALLADARRTIEAIDAMVMPETTADAAE